MMHYFVHMVNIILAVECVVVFPQNFTLEFHFSENDYFTNKVLTKSYVMSCVVPEEDPFAFEGATITSCTG